MDWNFLKSHGPIPNLIFNQAFTMALMGFLTWNLSYGKIGPESC